VSCRTLRRADGQQVLQQWDWVGLSGGCCEESSALLPSFNILEPLVDLLCAQIQYDMARGEPPAAAAQHGLDPWSVLAHACMQSAACSNSQQEPQSSSRGQLGVQVGVLGSCRSSGAVCCWR
jgi:hypothetical protein